MQMMRSFFNVSFSKSWYSVSPFVYGRFRMMSIVSSIGMFVKRDSTSKLTILCLGSVGS